MVVKRRSSTRKTVGRKAKRSTRSRSPSGSPRRMKKTVARRRSASPVRRMKRTSGSPKRRRSPNDYAKFVKAYYKTHRAELMRMTFAQRSRKVAAAYKMQKGGKRASASSRRRSASPRRR